MARDAGERGHCPSVFSKGGQGGGGAEVRFHNEFIGNFIVY